MGKRKLIDLSVIRSGRINKLVELAIKHDISPTSMAHLLGVSYSTYNRYVLGQTVPQSANTRAVIDNILKKLK